MSKYARTRITTEVSDASDYSRPKIHATEITHTPDEFRLEDEIEVATTAQTYYLEHLTSNTLLKIANLDASNTVLATFRIQKATKTFSANKLGFTATAPCTITDDDSTFISSLFFAAGDIAVISSATEAANSGSFFVQAAVAGTLTLAETVALTLDADDAGTPTIVSRRDITIPIGPGQAMVVAAVVPGSNLTLQAITAACTCEISFLGT